MHALAQVEGGASKPCPDAWFLACAGGSVLTLFDSSLWVLSYALPLTSPHFLLFLPVSLPESDELQWTAFPKARRAIQ